MLSICVLSVQLSLREELSAASLSHQSSRPHLLLPSILLGCWAAAVFSLCFFSSESYGDLISCLSFQSEVFSEQCREGNVPREIFPYNTI